MSRARAGGAQRAGTSSSRPRKRGGLLQSRSVSRKGDSMRVDELCRRASTGRHEARSSATTTRIASKAKASSARCRGRTSRDDRPRARRVEPVRSGGDRRLPRRISTGNSPTNRALAANAVIAVSMAVRSAPRSTGLQGGSPLAAPRRRQPSTAADGEHHQRGAPRRHEARVPGLPRRPRWRRDAPRGARVRLCGSHRNRSTCCESADSPR